MSHLSDARNQLQRDYNRLMELQEVQVDRIRQLEHEKNIIVMANQELRLTLGQQNRQKNVIVMANQGLRLTHEEQNRQKNAVRMANQGFRLMLEQQNQQNNGLDLANRQLRRTLDEQQNTEAALRNEIARLSNLVNGHNQERQLLIQGFKSFKDKAEQAENLQRQRNHRNKQIRQLEAQSQAIQREHQLIQNERIQLADRVQYLDAHIQAMESQKNIQIRNLVQGFETKIQQLQKIVFGRIQKILHVLQNAQNKHNIQKEELVKINRQFDFLYSVLENTRNETDLLNFVDTKKEIEKPLAQYLSDFKLQLEIAKQTYKQVHKGVDYNQLQRLIKHEGLVQGQNKTGMKNLLESIYHQYEKHLIEISVSVNKKENIQSSIGIFLNIYEFKEICEKMSQQYNLREDLLQDVLQKIFKQIQKTFQQIVELQKKGSTFLKDRLYQSIAYERRIKLNRILQQKYKKLLKQSHYYSVNSLEQWYEGQSKSIDQNFCKKYIKNFVIDEDLKTIYLNINQQKKRRIKESAIKSETKKVKQLLEQFQNNHDKLKENMKEKKELLDLCPNEIKIQIQKIYHQIDKKTNKFEQNIQKQIKSSIQNKNPQIFISSYNDAVRCKNSQTKDLIKKGMQSYIQKQKNLIDFQKLDILVENLNINIKFLESVNFKNISQEDSQIGSLKEQFIQKLKKEFQLNSKYFAQEFQNFKKQIILKNTRYPFKLYEFKTFETQIFTKAIKMLQNTSMYRVLAEQHNELISLVEQKINEQKINLEKKIKEIEIIILKIGLREEFSKQYFINTIIEAQISKHIYISMKNFNKVSSVKVRTEIVDQYDKTRQNLKSIIKQKYYDACKWNFQDSLFNDDIKNLIKRHQEMQKDLKVVLNYVSIFFKNSEISENCLANIKKKNEEQFKIFQQKTVNQIISCFKTDQKCSYQRVRHYYYFMEIRKSIELLAFPYGMEIGKQIKNLLINNFKQNTRKIEKFIANKQKISQFKEMIHIIQNLQVEEKGKISIRQKQIETERQALLKQLEDELNSELENISEDENKQTIIKRVTKEFAGKKSSKLNDFATIIQTFSRENIEDYRKKKMEIAVQINKFVQDQLIIDLIINRQARYYFGCQEEIRQSLTKFETFLPDIQKNYSKKINRYIYDCLKQNQNPISETIIDEEGVFLLYKDKPFGVDQKFDTLLNQMKEFKMNEEGKSNLLHRYGEYSKIYDQILDSYKKSYDYQRQDIQKKIIDQAIDMGNTLKKEYFDNKITNVVRWKLLAYIFALWTILQNAIDDNEIVRFIHQPHPGQILTIFLLLNLDDDKPSNQIEKCMIQVSTGEGKSVILGVLSTYLSLVGFDVYEACYSHYLSKRDYKDFKNFFTCLKVHNKIHYNIFPEICKLLLDESPGDSFTKKIHDFVIRPQFWQRISNYFNKLLPKDKKKQSILIIDEADVFIDEKYLGESYFPTISIKTQSFADLLNSVWNCRDQALSLKPQDIIKMKEFKEVCRQVNNQIFEKIMINQTNAMIRDLNSYKNDQYKVQNGKIYYKEADGISDEIHYGYRTIWAYFHESKINKKVSVNDLSSKLLNNLIVAGFSYSKLPFYFRSILGVTGTLEFMSDGQNEILTNEFDVSKTYIQPSIFPPSNRTISFKKCYNGERYEEITKNIQEEHQKQRPVVVFFRSKEETYDFFDSNEFSILKKNATVVTHENNSNERDFRIMCSTQLSKITLLTQDFSRGTDFKFKLKNPETHLGLHVICSFLPTSYSDYIQLTGRTGRQGSKGSVFILIGSEKELTEQQMMITREQAEDQIRRLDNKHWDDKLKEVRTKIQKANKQHDKCMRLYSSGTTVETIFELIKELNHEPSIMSYNLKTAICIDATRSMSAVLPKVIQVVKYAIPDIYKTIEDQNVEGSFQLKIVAYRNYSSGAQMLLQYTNFETKSEPLVSWLNSIKADGGQGNQAIEVCFQHINSLDKIHQCVIIGDAQANVQAETVSKRSSKTEQYWNDNGFALTNFKQQVQKLILKKIKVHSYYLNPSRTADFYNNLSADTSGVSKEFKIRDSKATNKFKDFVANKIIQNLGEMVGGNTKDRMLKRYMEVSNRKKKSG